MTPPPVKCTKCSAEIGEIVSMDGSEWLKVGRLVVRNIHGACECGEVFRWTASDRMLSELVTRVLEMRKNGVI